MSSLAHRRAVAFGGGVSGGIFIDASIAHGLFWDNDPYWTSIAALLCFGNQNPPKRAMAAASMKIAPISIKNARTGSGSLIYQYDAMARSAQPAVVPDDRAGDRRYLHGH